MAASVESSLAHPRKIGHLTSPRPRNLGRVPNGPFVESLNVPLRCREFGKLTLTRYLSVVESSASSPSPYRAFGQACLRILVREVMNEICVHSLYT
nr:hypothetical protein Q903MT_gene194 [Picea sitchensis]